MSSGGARARSGPAADPNALRRDRKDDREWLTLPVSPVESVPEFPLGNASEVETALWGVLWAKPQAHMWLSLGLSFQVAAYVRSFVESVEAGASAGLKTAVLRMEAELGISIVGMNALRWRFGSDELAEKRDETATVAPAGARARLKALGGS